MLSKIKSLTMISLRIPVKTIDELGLRRLEKKIFGSAYKHLEMNYLSRSCFSKSKGFCNLAISFNKLWCHSTLRVPVQTFSTSAQLQTKKRDPKLTRILVSKSQKPLSVAEFQNVCSHQSIIGLLISVVKFLLHTIAAVLKVLFHLIKALAGEKGQKFIGDATTKAKNLENKALRNDNIRKNFEKTKAVVQEQTPIVRAKIEDQMPSMRRSLDVFERRLDSELPGLKGKEKGQKFFELVTDLVKSHKVYQCVAIFVIVLITWKIVKLLSYFWS